VSWSGPSSPRRGFLTWPPEDEFPHRIFILSFLLADVLSPIMTAAVKSIIKRNLGSAATFFLVAAAGLFSGLFLYCQGLHPSDDAYITFRHVKNLVEHGAPAWNLGKRHVLGSTSPGFVFTLSAFSWITGVEPARAALYFNCGLLFFIVIFSYLIALDISENRFTALLLCLLSGFNSSCIFVFSQGFESALLILVLLAGCYSLRKNYHTVALLLASFAPLVRPEGILLFVIAWGYILITRRFRPAHIPVYIAIPLIWLLFSVWYYGDPIPQPIRAKQKMPSIYRPYTGGEFNIWDRLPRLGRHMADLWKENASPMLFSGKLSNNTESNEKKLMAAASIICFFILASAYIKNADSRIIYLLYPPLFMVFYALIGHTQLWYFPSLIIFSITGIFCACIFVMKKLWLLVLRYQKQLEESRFGKMAISHSLILAVFVLFLLTNNYVINTGETSEPGKRMLYINDPRGMFWELYEHERFAAYRNAANYLNNFPGDPGIALISEVGFFGYFYNGDVLDSVGVCSPEALDFYPPPLEDIKDEQGNYYTEANNFVPTNMVMTLKPDYLVNATRYIQNLLRPGNPFLEEYKFLAESGWAWASPVVIYKRVN
jgi:hypothetical protein